MTDEPITTEPEVPMIEKEKYLRLAADFENYKRMMEQQLTEVAKFGAQSVVLSMLDVLDHLEKAIAHAPPDIPPEWLTGLKHVGKQFAGTMGKLGIKRIETAGMTFDPATMEAVSMVPGGESHQVKEEIRAGYTLHERIIRPARVIIYQ